MGRPPIPKPAKDLGRRRLLKRSLTNKSQPTFCLELKLLLRRNLVKRAQGAPNNHEYDENHQGERRALSVLGMNIWRKHAQQV